MAFISCHDVDWFDDAVRHVRDVDQNDGLAAEYLSQPAYHGNVVPEFAREKNVLQALVRCRMLTTPAQ